MICSICGMSKLLGLVIVQVAGGCNSCTAPSHISIGHHSAVNERNDDKWIIKVNTDQVCKFRHMAAPIVD